jgi:peptide deformylase
VLLKLLQAGEPVLRRPARAVSVDELQSDRIQNLIQSMHQTLRDAPGVGLAAPQVGESLQIAIVEDRPEYVSHLTPVQIAEREREATPFHVIVNPRLTPIGTPDVVFFEGCLSVNSLTAAVPRYRQVRVDCLDEQGLPRTLGASGWYARILQHEIDHLNGILYLDRMLTRTLMTTDNFSRYWKDQSVAVVRGAFGA